MKKKITPGYILTQQKPEPVQKQQFSQKKISEAAIALGRMGGMAGGPARAKALDSKTRSSIAAHAANVRWGNINRPTIK